MNFKYFIVLILFLLTYSNSGFSQVKARVEGLKNNQSYMQLMEQEYKLNVAQDSIMKLIDQKKTILKAANDDGKVKLTNEILNLEGKLFEVRSQLGNVGGKSATMEQEYIIANIESGKTQTEELVDESKLRNFLSSSRLKGEISDAELKTITKTKQIDALIAGSIRDIAVKSIDARSIYTSYIANGDKIIADSLAAAHTLIINEIHKIDDYAVRQWDEIYTSKLDIYNRLLDKFGASRQVVDRLNETSRDMRSGESDIDAQFIAPGISKYVRQRLLVLDYEKELTTLLNLTSATDSITSEIKKIDVTKYDISKSVLPLQESIIYSPISRLTANAHSASNPPSELTIPTKGELYKIELGTYTKPLTTYTSLHRISPAEFLELADGKFRYWAGSYKTFDEAESASKNLNKLGLNTKVASWKDGINTLDPSLSVGEYKIKITSYTSELRALIAKEAPDKEITKSTDENGNTIYNIGIFQTKSDANRVAALIGADAQLIPIR
ncbi:MAG: hypothetical protein RR388_03450 [Rikenellaceae bacterium]